MDITTKIMQGKRHGIEVFSALFYINGKLQYKSEFLSKGMAFDWLTKQTNKIKRSV